MVQNLYLHTKSLEILLLLLIHLLKIWCSPTGTISNATGTAGTPAEDIDFFQKDTTIIDGTEVKADCSKLNDIDKTALQKVWNTGGSATATKAKKATGILQDTINKAIEEHNPANGTNLQSVKRKAGGNDADSKTFTFTSGQKMEIQSFPLKAMITLFLV